MGLFRNAAYTITLLSSITVVAGCCAGYNPGTIHVLKQLPILPGQQEQASAKPEEQPLMLAQNTVDEDLEEKVEESDYDCWLCDVTGGPHTVVHKTVKDGYLTLRETEDGRLIIVPVQNGVDVKYKLKFK
ncbi:hypothetical protein GOV04_01850 [Candidatus Woesearchaeota archaeon]|nr:hypothetical protein [Candidatus Woesearchaeota archaeon]